MFFVGEGEIIFEYWNYNEKNPLCFKLHIKNQGMHIEQIEHRSVSAIKI